jgi:hypothetical protein
MKRGLKKGKKVKIFELINTESEEITKLDSTKVKEKSCKQKKTQGPGSKNLKREKKICSERKSVKSTCPTVSHLNTRFHRHVLSR